MHLIRTNVRIKCFTNYNKLCRLVYDGWLAQGGMPIVLLSVLSSERIDMTIYEALIFALLFADIMLRVIEVSKNDKK